MKMVRIPRPPDMATRLREELERELDYRQNTSPLEESLDEMDFAEKIREEERKARSREAQFKKRGPGLQRAIEQLLKTVPQSF